MNQNVIFLILNGCLFIVCLALSIIAPFFPLFAEDHGIDEYIVGIIFSAHPIGDVISSLIIGKYMTPNNRLKLMCTGTMIVASGLFIFSGINFIDHREIIISICVFARFMTGFGSAMLLTPVYAHIQIIFPDQLEQKMAVCEFSSAIGFMLGPVFGSLLYTLGGFTLPFLVFGTLSVIMTIILPLILKDNQKDEVKALVHHTTDSQPINVNINDSMISDSDQPLIETIDEGYDISYLDAISHYDVIVPLVVCTSVSILFTYYNPIYSDFMQAKYQIEADTVGYYISFGALSYSIAAYFVSRIKEGKSLYTLIGLLITALFQFFMGPDEILEKLFNFDEHLWITLIAQLIWGFFSAFPFILSLPIISEKLLIHYPNNTEKCSNISSGLFKACCALGELIGPIAAGLLVGQFGFERCASFIGIELLLVCFMFIPIFMKELKVEPNKNVN